MRRFSPFEISPILNPSPVRYGDDVVVQEANNALAKAETSTFMIVRIVSDLINFCVAERQRSPAAPCAPYGGAPCWAVHVNR